ncbi:TRAP transporter substrate-binding protein [Pseudoflavonifractor phocaeensis]|uniref:TRAP transporter substrate-binding protein n=1 Tax=Pseudoflavonifractor phocaeensis TaxID=1870988 RepID=UPI001F2B149B|nr:TRAP transporter substrate-binding protein [Pseudoflavonifractor phocaeensis]MCF2662546.1 TRAP transporter substrate-binding protein [Pseudoflavonifractor phocaeensis]
MKKMLSLVLTLALALTLSGCAGSNSSGNAGGGSSASQSGSSSGETMTIKLATIGPETGTVMAEAEHVLMDYIETASNGAIQVEYFPNGALGSDLDLAEGLSNGSIQLATLGTSVLTSYTDKMGILDMPFLFTNSDSALKALNEGELGTILADAMDGTGIRFSEGNWCFGGYRGLSNSAHTIRTPDDMKGLKIRVMESPIFIDSFTLLGANPTPMAFGELFTALQNKTVDGQDNDPSLTYTCKFYEVQGYYTDLEHILTVSNMFMSESWYNSLSDDYKAIIDEACRQFAEYSTEKGLESYEENLKLLEDEGVEVTRLTDDERKQFKNAIISMYDSYIETMGQEIFDAAQAYN